MGLDIEEDIGDLLADWIDVVEELVEFVFGQVLLVYIFEI